WAAPSHAAIVAFTAGLERGPEVLDAVTNAVQVLPRASPVEALQNSKLKVEFHRSPDGYTHAQLFARRDDRWQALATLAPLLRVVSERQGQETDRELRPRQTRRQRDRDGTQSLELSGRIRDRDGVAWGVLLRATLPPAVGRLQLHYEWRVERERKVKALWGPN